LYLAPVSRLLLLAALVPLVAAAPAGAATEQQQLPIVVMTGLGLDDLPSLASHGAVGVLVPANGRETSGAQARAALERGEVRPSYLDGGLPTGAPRVSFLVVKGDHLDLTDNLVPQPPVIVVGLPAGGEQPNDRVYPVAVLGNGYHGLLTSSSTRLPGVVSIADIAPTALAEEDGLGWKAEPNAAARALALAELIHDKRDARLASGLLAAALIVLLAFVLPRAALFGYATALTANLALGATETSSLWIVLLSFALAAAAAVPLALRTRGDLALGLALAAVLVLYFAAFLADGSWVAYSPWGPPQNGRFYGVSNLLETMLLVPALAGAALLYRRAGWPAFAAVAAVSFVLIAGSRFGADGGGALVLAGGYAVLGCLLARLRGRRLVVAAGTTALVAGGLIALDAATGGSSHVTRAIGNGPDSLASHFSERLQVSWERATVAPGPGIATFLSLAVLVLLVVRLLRADAPLAEKALPLSFATAIAVSLIVNDSPGDVAVAGLVGYVVCEAVMLPARCAAAFCSRSFSALFWPAAEERRT
jgi:hypothetical protein